MAKRGGYPDEAGTEDAEADGGSNQGIRREDL